MKPSGLDVDTDALTTAGLGLLDAANEIPPPPEPITETGSDPLSRALTARTKAVEAPLIAGLLTTKADAIAAAKIILDAVGVYFDKMARSQTEHPTPILA